jgi:hypothetical protein
MLVLVDSSIDIFLHESVMQQTFFHCSILHCVSHLNTKHWNCLTGELKIKLANTVVGLFSFDYIGNWYFELATSTRNNSGACNLVDAFVPFVALFFSSLLCLLLNPNQTFDVICYVMLCYVTGIVALVSSRNHLWCLRLLLVPTSLLAVLLSIQGCNTVH